MKQKQTQMGNVIRSAGVTALMFLAACGSNETTEPNIIGSQGYRGMEELDQELTSLATPCSFVSGTGFATVAVASGETAVISKRVVDNAILVNGDACGTATSANLKKVTVTGSTGTDVVIIDFINGTFGNGSSSSVGFDIDLVSGSNDALKIRGSTGTDGIYFGADGASINADSNKDITFANVDDIVISAGAGNDVVSGAGGYGSGAEFAAALTIYGGAGNDTLTGGSAADTISGDEGNDTIAGADGDDTLNGNAGADTFNEGTVSNGQDTFAGGADSDTVSYASRTVTITATIGGTSDSGAASEQDTINSDVEVLTGGSGDDTLTGDANANTLNGGDGDDTLAGLAGADTLNGGAGNDTLQGGADNDTLNGDAGDDTFDEGSAGSNGSDVFNGGAGTDTLSYAGRTAAVTVTMDGAAANDGESGENDNCKVDVENITGGSGNDSLTGNNSNNVFVGGLGDDTLTGGNGNDTFDEGGPGDNGSDVFNGGAGTDLVDYSDRTAAITVTMDGVAADDGESGEADNVKSDVENLNGSSTVANNITGNALANVINGGSGNDTLNGGAENDTLFGGAGDDTINGDAGDDLLDAGDTADTDALDGGDGSGDICYGGDTTTNCEL